MRWGVEAVIHRVVNCRFDSIRSGWNDIGNVIIATISNTSRGVDIIINSMLGVDISITIDDNANSTVVRNCTIVDDGTFTDDNGNCTILHETNVTIDDNKRNDTVGSSGSMKVMNKMMIFGLLALFV